MYRTIGIWTLAVLVAAAIVVGGANLAQANESAPKAKPIVRITPKSAPGTVEAVLGSRIGGDRAPTIVWVDLKTGEALSEIFIFTSNKVKPQDQAEARERLRGLGLVRMSEHCHGLSQPARFTAGYCTYRPAPIEPVS
jgi:hypothetical protein